MIYDTIISLLSESEINLMLSAMGKGVFEHMQS